MGSVDWHSQAAHAVSLPPRWLFEGLGRDKAEELLQLPDTKVGSFMIRESETKKGEQPTLPPWHSRLPLADL